MTYSLALLSSIPVVAHGAGFISLDLWVRDLQAQIVSMSDLTLFSPVQERPPGD